MKFVLDKPQATQTLVGYKFESLTQIADGCYQVRFVGVDEAGSILPQTAMTTMIQGDGADKTDAFVADNLYPHISNCCDVAGSVK